ncbi:ATP-binding protein [Marinobacter salicampi]|uniref:ATP-binding protein n=1 Tax=Marinobacter salicampi TaxID=435907 RepID=UPI00140BE7C1|nr:ATP-binding protein [Marinobacter salicampi]
MEELKNIDVAKVANLNIKISHRNWKEAFAKAFVLMSTTKPGDVIALIGPTRAGKSELLNQLKVLFTNDLPSECEEQPLVLVELVNDDKDARFTFRSFILQALEILKHPFYSSWSADGWGDPVIDSRLERAREKTLNRALIRALKQRKTRYLVIDEAQHIRFAGRDTMAASGVMDALKVMAKKAEVVLIIAGTYPILEAINRSSHLEARKYDVHLSRYHQNEDDMAEFRWILAHYERFLDLDKSIPNLLDQTELLYRASFGCIGLVRAILYEASVVAVAAGSKIGLTTLQSVIKSSEQLFSIADEILIGEQTLGILPCSVLTSAVTSRPPEKRGKKKPSGTSKPFQRKPKRYEIGNRT